MLAVAIGWQVYAIRRNPLDLGLVGLMEFLPLPLLALPAGQIADRLPRRAVTAAAFALNIAIAVVLLVVTLGGAHEALAVPRDRGGLRRRQRDRQPGRARAARPSSSRTSCCRARSRCAASPGQIGVIAGPALGGHHLRRRARSRSTPRPPAC